MNKYKVEMVRTDFYVVDVEAESANHAVVLARRKWKEIEKNNMEHYHQVGDTSTMLGYIHDVTNTDDPFDATV